MPSFIDDTDSSVISRYEASTCEYLGKSNTKVLGWMNGIELLKVDEECSSLYSDSTTKEEMLDHIHGIYEADNKADNQYIASDSDDGSSSEANDGVKHVASDTENHGQDSGSYVFESMFTPPDNNDESNNGVQQIASDSEDHGHESSSYVLESTVMLQLQSNNANIKAVLPTLSFSTNDDYSEMEGGHYIDLDTVFQA